MEHWVPPLASRWRLGNLPFDRHFRSSRHAPHVGVDRRDRAHDRGARRNQSPHSRGETRHSFAGFERLVDEGSGERARQPDPEYNGQAPDLIFQRLWFLVTFMLCE
jgi:hypothetical protein